MLLLPGALAHGEGSGRGGLVVLVDVSGGAVVRVVRIVSGLGWPVVARVVFLVLPHGSAGLGSWPRWRGFVLVDDPLGLGHGRVVRVVDAGRRRRVASALLQVLFAPGVRARGAHRRWRRGLTETTLDVDFFLAVNPAHRRRRRRYELAYGFTFL